MSDEQATKSYGQERAELAATLAEIEAAEAGGGQHTTGYRANFYRQQIAELDALLAEGETSQAPRD